MKLKILHINDKIELSGGVETYIKQICDNSYKYNIKSDWIGLYKNSDYRILSYRNSTKILFSGKLKDLKNYLSDFVSKHSFDVIHIHSITNSKIINHCFSIAPVVRTMHEPRMICPGQGKFLRFSERACNKPFGLHCFFHSYKEGCCNRHPVRLLKSYKNVLFEALDASKKYSSIIVMSKYMLDEAIKAGYSKKKLILNSLFTPKVNESDFVYSSKNKIKSLIFIGRLSKTKGLHYAIKSVINLLDRGYSVQFDIIGSGYDEKYFRSLIPHKYETKFIFHGWKDRSSINQILQKAYIMIFPSIYPEAFGLSGIEAMMNNKPVVGFNVGGVSTWLKDNETGFLVPAKDYKVMSDRLSLLIDDFDLYKRFSKNAKNIALSDFSEKRHMKLLKSTYLKSKSL